MWAPSIHGCTHFWTPFLEDYLVSSLCMRNRYDCVGIGMLSPACGDAVNLWVSGLTSPLRQVSSALWKPGWLLLEHPEILLSPPPIPVGTHWNYRHVVLTACICLLVCFNVGSDDPNSGCQAYWVNAVTHQAISPAPGDLFLFGS